MRFGVWSSFDKSGRMELNHSAKIHPKEPVCVAILGCGAITELFHAPALHALEKTGEIRVTHLLDPSPERVARIRKIFPEASALLGLSALSKVGADLVVVASPVQFHAEQTIAALEAGTAVLCEKPMAATLLEARRMLSVVEQTSQLLAIGLCRRFFPTACAIQQMLRSGVLGRLQSFDFQEGNDFKWPALTPSFFQKQAGGGGVLMDLGVHVIDLLYWWFGLPSTLTYKDDAMGGVEANCELHLHFAVGLSGRVRLSRDWPLRRFCRIEGERGSVEWHNVEADKLTLKLKDGHYLWKVNLNNVSPGWRESTPLSGLEGAFLAQAKNIIAAIHGQEPIRVSGTEGIRSLEIIESCYQHRKLMEMPWFTEAEKQAATVLNRKS